MKTKVFCSVMQVRYRDLTSHFFFPIAADTILFHSGYEKLATPSPKIESELISRP